MSAARRAVLRLVPPGGPVLVAGALDDDVLLALTHRGDRLLSPDEAAATAVGERLGRAVGVAPSGAPADAPAVAVVRPRGDAALPDTAVVVTDLVLAGPDGTDLAALRALATAPGRRVRTVLLLPEPGGGVRWVARWTDRSGDGAARPEDDAGARRGLRGPAAGVLDALVGTLDLVAAGSVAAEEALEAERWRVGDRQERLRAAERAVSTAQAGVRQLTDALAEAERHASDALDADEQERAGSRAVRLVRALRGTPARPPAPLAPADARRPVAPAAALDGTTSGVRVQVLGDDAAAWCAGVVRQRPLPPPPHADERTDDPADAPLAVGHDHLEALVLGARLPDGWDVAAATRLVARVRDSGLPVLGVRPGDVAVPWFDGLVDVELGPTADVAGAGPTRVAGVRPVAPAAVSGRGFRRSAAGAPVVVPDGPVAPGAVADLRAAAVALERAQHGRRANADAADAGPTALLSATDRQLDVAAHAGGLPVERVPSGARTGGVSVADPGPLLQRLRAGVAVLDHPGLHPDPGAHAHWLAVLALARVPVLLAAPLPRGVAALLGDELAAAIAATTTDELADHVLRERATVRAHRAAYRAVTPTALWRRVAPALGLPAPRHRTVSMVLATNRPDHLLHAVEQAAAQRWARRELVVVLHGAAFDGGWPERVARHAAAADPDLPLTVLRADDALLLGEVLDAGCEAASGQLVTKIDDDDWYSPDHLVDLLAAREHSGAQVVGKAAEFTYLAELDLTVRRMADGGESGSRSLAGGTFMLGRDELWALGGWPHTPRFVDQRLLDALLEAGGRLHRGHGFGYVLNRHATGHTWDAGADYFLRQAVTQHPGLALDVAGVTDLPAAP